MKNSLARPIGDNQWQSLEEHLQGTAQRAEAFASAFGCGEWGKALGWTHDLGKLLKAFQKKLIQ